MKRFFFCACSLELSTTNRTSGIISSLDGVSINKNVS